MSEQSTICKEGIVRAVNGNTVDVEIIVSSACAGCHAKSICIPSDHRQEIVTANVEGNHSFKVGERVNLVLRGNAGAKAVLIAYAIPFVVLLAAFIGCYLLSHNELVSVLVSLLFVLVYFLILKTQIHKINRNFTFYVTKMTTGNMDTNISKTDNSMKIISTKSCDRPSKTWI